MANFFDRQKFQSELIARGVTMTNEEIDAYIETQNELKIKPKSYLPYKSQQAESANFSMPSLNEPYAPPPPKENALIDFLGNTVWEALDVTTFGALGALDYDDYYENLITTGGPGTFAGRVGAGIGGLAGFMLPMAGVKAVAGAAVKAGKYGTKAAAKKMLHSINTTKKIGASGKPLKGTILGSTKYSTLSPAKKNEIWSPFVNQLNKYGHKLENIVEREKFIAKLDQSIRPTIVRQLEAQGIKPSPNTITQLEKIVKEGMGVAEGSAMPLWNLQQRIARQLGGSQGAGKIASVASHIMEEAAIFAAVETPMEFFNSIDEFRDPDYVGTVQHGLALGGVLGAIRFIPGGKDQPIIKTAFHRLNKMFQGKRSYMDLNYGTEGARDILKANVNSMFGLDPKLFEMALSTSAKKKLGIDVISSKGMVEKLINGTYREGLSAKEGSQILASAMGNIEKNWTKRWWKEFWKESSADMVGSLGRMTAGAVAFNHSLIFDDNVPLEDKVFNVLVGAFMTKRGRVMEYTNGDGKTVVWEHTQRPWTYSDKLKEIDRHLSVLGLEPEPFFKALAREGELRNEIIDISNTKDVKSIMEVMASHDVIVSKDEPVKNRKKAEETIDHELYAYIEALSGFYINGNTEQRMLTVKELSKKRLDAIASDLSKLELIGTKDGKGLRTVADMQGIVYDANFESVSKLIDLYKLTVRDMYAVAGEGEAGNNLLVDDLHVSKFHQGDMAKLSEINPEAFTALHKVAVVRDLLNEHNLLTRSDNANAEAAMRLDLSESGQRNIIEAMTRLENDLHQMVYKGEEVGEINVIPMGDGMLSNVINVSMVYKSIRDSFSRLESLQSDSNAWKVNKKTGSTDRNRINDLIMKIFTSGEQDLGLLADRVVVDMDAKSESIYLQEFANTMLDILPHTTPFGTPTGFGEGTTNHVSRGDIKSLMKLMKDNGMGGFLYQGENLAGYINDFKGYALDQKLAGATTNDGKLITGVDRSKIGALIQNGLVNNKLELISITKAVESLVQVKNDTKLWQGLVDLRLDRGQDFIPLTKDLADRLAKIVPPGYLNEIKEFAKTYNIDLPNVIDNILGKYEKHVLPYIKKGEHGTLSIRTGIEAEADLATITELITKLDNIEKSDLKLSHKGLMDTLSQYATKEGLTAEEQAFVSELRNTFWSRPSEASKVISILARYGYENDKGVFVPLYNKSTNTLDLSFPTAIEAMNQASKHLEKHIPVMARSEMVNQRMRELSNEPILNSDNNTSITPQSFLEKYNLVYSDKDVFHNILKSSDPTGQFILNGAHIKDKDGKAKYYEDMDADTKLEFVDDTIRLMFTMGASRKINRLTVGEGAGIWSDFDNTMTDNHLFRFLDDQFGYGNFKIVGRKVETRKGIMDSRDGKNDSINILKSVLYDGYEAVDINLKSDSFGTTRRAEPLDGHVFVNIGDYSWGIAIPRNKLPELYTQFGEFIKDSKGKYRKGKYKKVFTKLNRIYQDKGIEAIEGAGKEFKESDYNGDGSFAEAAVTMMWMDKMAKDIWWDHLAETTGKKDYDSSLAVAKWAKRIRLMSNVSSKEMSNEHVSRVIDLHTKHKTLEKNGQLLEDMKSLQANEGLNLVMVQDEGANSEIFSVMKGYLDQINKENKEGGLKSHERDNITKGKDGLEIQEGGKKRGDASIADSVMIMPVKWFRALQSLVGFTSLGKIGGMKPLISSVGDGLLLGKTAILPDTRFDGFFSANENVHAVLMMSGVKMNKNVLPIDVKNLTMDDLQNYKLAGDENISSVKWKDINLGPAVAVEHAATISYQLSNELGGHHSNSFYDWLIAPQADRYERAMNDFANSRNTIGTTAFARALSEPGTGDNAALSVMDMWLSASNGGGPVHFTGVLPTFKNSFKRKFVDDGMLQLHNSYGSQSVMSPYFGGSKHDLRNTTFYTPQGGSRGVWTIGQGEIGWNNSYKKVPLDRLSIVVHKNKGKDGLISYRELAEDVNFIRSIKAITGNKKLGQNESLITVHNVLKHYNRSGSKDKIKIYDVIVDMYELPGTKGKDGQDIWHSNSKLEAQAQADEMKKSAQDRGEGYNFADKIEKYGKKKGVYILKDLKEGREDHKIIYVGKAFNKMKDAAKTIAEKPIRDRKGRKRNTIYKKYMPHKDTHEVAMTWHRTPSTRQSDKIIVGLKGFIDSELGNQARLNAWDTYARAEADFDIDKINYWWDTPHDILQTWHSNAGKTSFVSEESPEFKTTLREGYDWLDPSSMERLAGDIAHAEKMRGVTAKAQRIVQFLSQYNSAPGDMQGFALSIKGGKQLSAGDQKIIFDFDRLDDNRHLLAEDIQRVIDSYSGYNKELYDMAWLDKFLFGNGDRYQGVFKRVEYDGNKWDTISGESRKGETSWTQLEQDIIKAVIAPYRNLLQAGTNIYEGGEAKTPRYDDLITMMQSYDTSMGNLTRNVYNNLKRKYWGNTEQLTQLKNTFFGEKKGQFRDVFGNFGAHASTRQSKEPNMPFERMLSVLAYGNKFNQDSPKKLWGSELQQFENFYESLMGATGQARQDVYKQMNYDLKKDFGTLKFVNYLKWREGTLLEAARNAKKDNLERYAASITEQYSEIKAQRLDLEKNLVNDPLVMKHLQNVAAKRIQNDILASPGNHNYRAFGIPKFNDFKHATNWINKNAKSILSIAAKQPIKYRAIDSPEYRDALIFHEMLSKYENIFIDPSINSGRNFQEFNNDVIEFSKLRSSLWKEFFNDKKRRDGRQSPWMNESRLMNTLTTEFTRLFDKWNDPANSMGENGLGMLLLWKTMMPQPLKGEYTYYNKKLAPAFHPASMGMVKFGLRFIANADETRISKFQKRMFFDIMASQYTDWYDFFNGKRQTTTEGMRYRDMYDMSLQDTYDNPSPLREYWRDNNIKETQAEQLNPLLHSMFGVDPSYTYGFVGKDVTSAGAARERTDFNVFPRGYIPINYRGGDHPRIIGWDSWNKAREGEAYLMLGESLSKNILGFTEKPIIKNVFNQVNAKEEGRIDIEETIKIKGRSSENGSKPEC